MNSPIMEYITSNVDYSLPEPEILPVMHSCDVFDCESIIDQSFLNPTLCPVFGEDLLYFFYGKPTYPIGTKEDLNRTDSLYCPVCFIIDIDNIDIYRIFPFDSGAFDKGLYKQFMHRHMNIDRFEIENNSKAIKAYISVIFGNNTNYINGTPIKNHDEDTYVNALLNLLSATGGFEFDERADTIEVISKKSIDISKNVLGIILPENFLRKDKILYFINENNIEYKTYAVRSKTSPLRYNEVVFQLAMEFCKERKND